MRDPFPLLKLTRGERHLVEMSICLNMIVKDESHIIVNTLRHLLKYIKFSDWVISDTGSTDGTQDLIRNFFAEQGIPGVLTEDPWVDFGHNRSVAFKHARTHSTADYLFVWDADDEIVGDFKLPATLTADQYLFTFGGEGFRYNRVQLFSNKKKWRYVGVLHEYPSAEEGEFVRPPEQVAGNYYFVSGRSGSRNKDPNKYHKDALVLEKGIAAEPNNARYIFYCAQSYQNAQMPDKAIEFYKKVLASNAWVEEKYVSCYEMAQLFERKGDSVSAVYYLVEAFQHVQDRAECAYHLIKHYCVKGAHTTALLYYSFVQKYYEQTYLADPAAVSSHLFVHKDEYDFYLPYHVIIAAIGAKQWALAINMYRIIFRQNFRQVDVRWVNNMFHNIQFIKDHLPLQDASFLQELISYRNQFHGEIGNEQNKHIAEIIAAYEPQLTMYPTPLPITLRKTPKSPIKVLFTITSCKRYDLFERTMNSVLNTWKDLRAVDHFLCVDDNSSKEDRAKMRKKYPFFEFYMKTADEKGHRASMNIIWQKLNELQPTYWIHMEDDWLFFKTDNYVTKSIVFLEKHKDQNIQQILFNRNYAETYEDWRLIGGRTLDAKKEFAVHVKADMLPGPNCGYWPHYSFRPSMVRASVIRELGNYDSPNTFFEMDYATRWSAAGHQSAFYNSITSRHIGKLTSDKTGTNAYTLNAESQFAAPPKHKSMYVVNLKRRADRKEAVVKLLRENGFADDAYTIYEAVDGLTLQPTADLRRLFKGNDFGNRRGVIGCALSHYNLWKQLADDDNNDYYTIFEDDIAFVDGFREKLPATPDPTIDVLFLGYHTRTQEEKTVAPPLADAVQPLNKDAYIGGTFGYIVTKQGARKYLEYIAANGIKHGIDYLAKIIPNFNCANLQPHAVLSDWVQTVDSVVDSDIQKDPSALDLSENNWFFYPGLDVIGSDVRFVGKKNGDELYDMAKSTLGCNAYNTLGFLKSVAIRAVTLTPSPYFGPTDGLYLQQPLPVRVKMMCNWSDSATLCRTIDHMTEGSGRWKNLVFTHADRADYYVILNKPQEGDYYDPAKTIVFQMEPWCADPTQTWGVKTWGEWATPDPAKFLHVGAHKDHCNIAEWQLSYTYDYLKTATLPAKEFNSISCICSAKYFDPGHKYRVDFIRFLESKGDPDVSVAVFGAQNFHGFRGYGGAVDNKKETKIAPYKYYFMTENNAEANYITEKLWEPILCESLCFYWGAPNVAEHVDPRAFVQLDMTDFEASYRIMKEAIASDLWTERLPYIRIAKQKILDEQGMIPTIHRIVKLNE